MYETRPAYRYAVDGLGLDAPFANDFESDQGEALGGFTGETPFVDASNGRQADIERSRFSEGLGWSDLETFGSDIARFGAWREADSDPRSDERFSQAADEQAWTQVQGYDGGDHEGDAAQLAGPGGFLLDTLHELEAGEDPSLAERLKGAALLAVGPTLQRGDSGSAVAALQRALVSLGDSITADGDFGPATERAVRAFQSRSGLDADGVVGAHTKLALAAALRGAAPQPLTPPSPLPTPPPTPQPVDDADLDAFLTRLSTEWSRRKGGQPSPAEMRERLRKDHDDTQAGAQLRWKGKASEAAVRRAWMISREEQMRFETERHASVRPLGAFGPPAQSPGLVSDRRIVGSDKAPVAPIMLRFVDELRRRYSAGLDISNYRGHGGGSFLNRGYSLDLFIRGRDARGFYPRQAAIDLLRAIHGAAGAVRAQWRVIYNDFAVADAINRETGRNNVIFVGNPSRGGGRVTGLNWHGPDPLIIHFHLDLAPSADSPESETDETTGEEGLVSDPASQPTGMLGQMLEREAGLGSALADRLKGLADLVLGPALKRGDSGPAVAALQTTLARLGADLAVDGDFGPNTDRAVRDFQSRSGLDADGVVGAATKAALSAAVARGGGPAPAPTPPGPAPTPAPAPGVRLTPAQFVAAYGPSARTSQANHGVPALVTLGQAALESGWGQHAPRFNFFGIKARATDPEDTRQLLRTREVLSHPNGRFPEVISVTPRPDGRYDYIVRDWFRTFPDAATAFDGHGQFLVRNKRYAKAFTVAHDAYLFAAEVARAGYATDPSYERVLASIMRMTEAAGGP